MQNNVTVTGVYVNSAAYNTPTVQYNAPLSAAPGMQPLTITTADAVIVDSFGTSGGGEPAWPTVSGLQTVQTFEHTLNSPAVYATTQTTSGGGGGGKGGSSHYSGSSLPVADFNQLNFVLGHQSDAPGVGQVNDGEIMWTAFRARIIPGAVTAVFNGGQFEDAYNPAEVGFFQNGFIQWTSGRNAGLRMEVREYTRDPRPCFFLLEAMPYKIQVGDEYVANVGCNKTRPMCENVFMNLNNFRGCPDMPTEDRALITPNFTQSGTQSKQNSGS
jgi:hypothetical protein